MSLKQVYASPLCTQRKLPDEYIEVYDKMLATIAETRGVSPSTLAAFLPRCGHKYNGNLMVIGRALNGWQEEPITLEILANIDERQAVIREERLAAESLEVCPMNWLIESDGIQRPYNAKGSAFWRVAHTSANHFSDVPQGDSASWPNYICWSNLYKVAPAERRNPTGKLKSVQESFSADLIRREIAEFAPSRILVLTGREWFEPFAERLNLAMQWRIGLVEGICRLPGQQWVIAQHPQGKSDSAVVAEAWKAFKGYL